MKIFATRDAKYQYCDFVEGFNFLSLFSWKATTTDKIPQKYLCTPQVDQFMRGCCPSNLPIQPTTITSSGGIHLWVSKWESILSSAELRTYSSFAINHGSVNTQKITFQQSSVPGIRVVGCDCSPRSTDLKLMNTICQGKVKLSDVRLHSEMHCETQQCRL